jgi:hypothetical protein
MLYSAKRIPRVALLPPRNGTAADRAGDVKICGDSQYSKALVARAFRGEERTTCFFRAVVGAVARLKKGTLRCTRADA